MDRIYQYLEPHFDSRFEHMPMQDSLPDINQRLIRAITALFYLLSSIFPPHLWLTIQQSLFLHLLYCASPANPVDVEEAVEERPSVVAP